jgi:hypothetical protein
MKIGSEEQTKVTNKRGKPHPFSPDKGFGMRLY